MLFRFCARIHINECSAFDRWVLLIFILLVTIRRKIFNNYRRWRQLCGERRGKRSCHVTLGSEESFVTIRRGISWRTKKFHFSFFILCWSVSWSQSLPAGTSNATAEENNQELNPQPEITQSTPSNVPENISVYPTDEVSVKLKFCSFAHYTRHSWWIDTFESTLRLWWRSLSIMLHYCCWCSLLLMMAKLFVNGSSTNLLRLFSIWRIQLTLFLVKLFTKVFCCYAAKLWEISYLSH